MSPFKDALRSLSPIAYDDLPSNDALPQFIREAFSHAELLLNSIPTPNAEQAVEFTPCPANNARNAEETYCDPTHVPAPTYDNDPADVKGWGKPIKFNTKENPLGVQVYKMAAHDRHGAWFARRSIHQGIGFNKWKKAATHEFVESLKIQQGPGSGAVRGVAADRRIEKRSGPNESTIEVWQTSSAFPGPVTPRESLTLLISSSSALSERPKASVSQNSTDTETHIPRHFLVISRPTRHADAPVRANLVKMEYESAEMIREISIEGNSEPEANPIEWLMITRSDPGGGIPRFMVERGTPSSIVGDVGKFLKWATSKNEADLDQLDEDEVNAIVEAHTNEAKAAEEKTQDGLKPQAVTTPTAQPVDQDAQASKEGSEGLVSKVAEAVGSTVSGYLPAFQQQMGVATDTPEDNASDVSSDISDASDGTFRSALHEQVRSPLAASDNDPWNDSTASLNKSSNGNAEHSRTKSREFDKILQKRAALDEKARKDRDAFAQKTAEAAEKESKERTKIIDKHEKQRKKQEERYQRELTKLDERRLKEERREEERRRKAEAKDEMTRLKHEIAEWKSRCQIAEQEADLLKKQVETLQRQNTAMAAHLPEDEAKSLLSSESRQRTSSSKPASTKSGTSSHVS